MTTTAQTLNTTTKPGFSTRLARPITAARQAKGISAFLGGFGKGAALALLTGFAIMGASFGSSLGLIPDVLITILLGMLLLSIGGLVGMLWRLIGHLLAKASAAKPEGFAARLRRGWEAIPLSFWEDATPALVVVLTGWIGGAGFDNVPVLNFHINRLLVPVGAICGGLLGLAISQYTSARMRWVWASAGLLPLFVLGGWLIWPGSTAGMATAPLAAYTGTPLAIADPSAAGPYEVRSLSYGSNIGRRAEYTTQASLHTNPVDVSSVFQGFTGLAGDAHRFIFGFDTTNLPLNALVWYPQGEGPFPLLLIVHGNHSLGDFSEPGYAYLGEHLASHGFIVASVDENFLNGGVIGDLGGDEMPVRGFLLLKHLQAWRTWNEDPASPFFGLVDMDRIALAGHSRGGEAVQHAWLLNQDAYRPYDQLVTPGEFGFNIRALIAIAPSDRMYRPENTNLVLKDVSYLLIMAGHDTDTATMLPIRTFNSAIFSADSESFKALWYVYRGNHAGFNTVWAASGDRGLTGAMLINRAPYLSTEDQQRSAKIAFTAFLQATLLDQDEQRQVFQNPAATAAWQPGVMVTSTYQDTSYTALPLAPQQASGFTTAASRNLPLRDKESLQEDLAMYLQWEAGSQPVFSVALDSVAPDSALYLEMGAQEQHTGGYTVSLELSDVQGNKASLDLTGYGEIQPVLSAGYDKSAVLNQLIGYDPNNSAKAVETVLQGYTIPWSAFAAQNPQLDLTALNALRLVFHGDAGGAIYLDELGLID